MSAVRKMHDLAGADERARFSPYCWRTRLALAHKGLPVETIPWRFTEKEAIAFSGQGFVPVLVDGERCISDSWTIAQYLEEAYPDAPSLFGGVSGLAMTRFINQWATDTLNLALVRVLLPDIHAILHPKDQDYFRTTREKRFGMTIEAVRDARETNLTAMNAVLRPLNATLTGQDFLSGTGPAYADHVVFASFQWARVASPLNILDGFEAIAAWRERLLDAYGGLARATPAHSETVHGGQLTP